MFKVAIVGSTRYVDIMRKAVSVLQDLGYEARIPVFDGDCRTELEIVENNRELIRWADIVVVYWDGASIGTVFDMGMAYALEKPILLAHLNRFSFANLLKQLSVQGQKVWRNSILEVLCE